MIFTQPILITGATGYVGGRLIPRLIQAGYTIRAMGRSMDKLACRPWSRHPQVQLIQGDVLDVASLERAAQGCDAAYYLVHAMVAQDKKFAEADRTSALNMRHAAERAGLKQMIYLGGLGDVDHPHLSHHLASRHEVGDILQSGKVPTTLLRAAMILGSGSASFEILRYLVEILPIMITPRWVESPTQPIAIENVLDYLQGCLGNEATLGKGFDIGGPEVLNYKDLIHLYAQAANLPRRRIIQVPVLTPKLSALWIHLVTPVPSSLALPLTQGLSVPTICKDNSIKTILPLKLKTCRQTIRQALESILDKQVQTCWSDAGDPRPPEWAYCGDADYAGGTILTCAYRITIDTHENALWSIVTTLGGDTGYYYGDWLWRLRGWIDRWSGGIGLRRGRRHPVELRVGDALDFWRVLTVLPNQRLTLLAEMKVPGDAVLDIQIHGLNPHQKELRMVSRFLPRGLAGRIYWYALYPFHVWLFKGMLKAMAAAVTSTPNANPQRFDPRTELSCALSFSKTHKR